jgi:integrase
MARNKNSVHALPVYGLTRNENRASTLRIEQGKGRRTRIVPLTASAMAALKLYLDKPVAKAARQTHCSSRPDQAGRWTTPTL